MTTPIMNVLDIAQQPPFVVGWQELDKFHRAITALYEQQTKEDREAFLIDDCKTLVLRLKMFGGTPQTNIQLIDRNEQIQGSIEEIARLLLSVARDLNTHLPESFVEQCRNSTDENTSRFYGIISEVYITPARKTDNKADSGTKGAKMGSNATTQPETPPSKKTRPRGRPQKEFEEFFIKQEDAPKVIPILEELLKGKYGKDAALIIVACYKGGWITEPTPVSIERKFGIEASGLKEPLRCHFHYVEGFKYKPFSDENLTPIVEKIKEKLNPTPQK